jgi:hypothetical protein
VHEQRGLSAGGMGRVVAAQRGGQLVNGGLQGGPALVGATRRQAVGSQPAWVSAGVIGEPICDTQGCLPQTVVGALSLGDDDVAGIFGGCDAGFEDPEPLQEASGEQGQSGDHRQGPAAPRGDRRADQAGGGQALRPLSQPVLFGTAAPLRHHQPTEVGAPPRGGIGPGALERWHAQVLDRGAGRVAVPAGTPAAGAAAAVRAV